MKNRRDFLKIGAFSSAYLGITIIGSKTPLAQSQIRQPIIGLAYALGGRGDQSYNDAVATALPDLRKQFRLTEYSPATTQDYSRSLATLAEGKPIIIFCVGFIYDTFVNQLAPVYPNTHFCVLDGSPNAGVNTLGIQFRVNEASSLAGVVAGDHSKTGTIGFVGGSDIPPIREFLDGYTMGAKRFRPDIRILSRFAGSGAAAFTDPAKGKDLGLQLISEDADVLFHAAGGTGNGVISAARQRGRMAIGVDVDQSHLAPGTVITSVLKKLDVAVLHVSSSLSRGIKLPSGILSLGLKENGVGLVSPHTISDRARQMIAELESEYGVGK